MYSNSAVQQLPDHLKELIVDQHYENYTPQDHALWRYVMRQNVRYLSKVAHHSYLEGLKSTGIGVDRIPNVVEMNAIMEKIGWGVVAVDGFIPPSAFMEFQAYKVLVIAADIRPIDQIGYTPAPDIIHEAAGHAPIIADPEYAEYLRLFGEIGSKAFQSKKDYELYEAIRHLSILKADPYTPTSDIEAANKRLANIEQSMGEPSEMAKIRNLHWWTVEYGLIGDLTNPQIYGAGLLSSISESFNCLQPSVEKRPYTLDAATVAFDITEEQPQLFVTPDFKHLTRVLMEFAAEMGLTRGGLDAALKAKNSGAVATLNYSSGLQVSGVLIDYFEHHGELSYVQFTGPCQLAFQDKQIHGHGKDYHSHGFSSPVGKLKGVVTPLEMMNQAELKDLGLVIGRESLLEFESGVRVKGVLRSMVWENGHLILISFDDCVVNLGEQVLFQPEWGTFDMAIGASIFAGFAGPADARAFELTYPIPEEKTHKIHYSEQDKALHRLYQKVRNIREGHENSEQLKFIFSELVSNHPNDWLCALEIYELTQNRSELVNLNKEVLSYLNRWKEISSQFEILVQNGLDLLHAD